MLRTVVPATLALAASAVAQSPNPNAEGDVPPAAFLEAARNKVIFPEARNAYFGDVGARPPTRP